jgi:hypothetical protein
MSSPASRLDKFKITFVSKDPEIVMPAAQISFPPPPTYWRSDCPSVGIGMEKEIEALEDATKHISIVREFIPFLYTYRSLSRSVNFGDYIKSAQDDPELNQRYMATYSALMRPRLDKMFEMRTAIEKATQFLADYVEKSPYPSDVFLEKTVELFDAMFNIDQMKLFKAGLTNDLSVYRRQLDSRTQAGKEEQMKTGFLAPFLAQRYQSLEQLKSALKEKPSPAVVKFFSSLLSYCVSTYRSSFIIRRQEYSLVIGIVSSFFLCAFTPFQSDKELLNQCYQILSQNPFVQLVAELNFLPGAVIQTLPGFSPPRSALIVTNATGLKAMADQYMLSKKMGTFRDLFKDSLDRISSMSQDDSLDVSSICQLLLSLNQMASGVVEQFAYKCDCPAKKTSDTSGSPAGTGPRRCTVPRAAGARPSVAPSRSTAADPCAARATDRRPSPRVRPCGPSGGVDSPSSAAPPRPPDAPSPAESYSLSGARESAVMCFRSARSLSPRSR